MDEVRDSQEGKQGFSLGLALVGSIVWKHSFILFWLPLCYYQMTANVVGLFLFKKKKHAHRFFFFSNSSWFLFFFFFFTLESWGKCDYLILYFFRWLSSFPSDINWTTLVSFTDLKGHLQDISNSSINFDIFLDFLFCLSDMLLICEPAFHYWNFVMCCNIW